MKPTAIIATWMNEGRTRGFHLQADGSLVAVYRPHASAMWSAPDTPIALERAIAPFERLLERLA